jgi:homogentisate phytyltransferase/homogentisate geranylgeranyltransferase
MERMKEFLGTLWAFTRPHTIIGSLLSISSLYVLTLLIAYPDSAFLHFKDTFSAFGLTLLSALACNLYITGLNQVKDVPIDRINKPWLPLVSGRLSLRQGRQIVITAGMAALAAAAWVNFWLLGLIALIMLIGTAYSLPPIQLKRFHIWAALCILLVRGVLVNIGMPQQFLYEFTGFLAIPDAVWPLTLFVTGFSIGIAWFKDIPDTEGDARYQIKTFAITVTPKVAFRAGVIVVALSYIGLLLLTALLHLPVKACFFFPVHGLLLLLFLVGAARLNLQNTAQLKKFYMAFWVFFFVEYLIYPLGFWWH